MQLFHRWRPEKPNGPICTIQHAGKLITAHSSWFPATDLTFSLGTGLRTRTFCHSNVASPWSYCSVNSKGYQASLGLQIPAVQSWIIKAWVSPESQNGEDWKGPLEVIKSNPAVQAGIPRTGCLGPRPSDMVFWRPPRREDSTTSGADSDEGVLLGRKLSCNIGWTFIAG